MATKRNQIISIPPAATTVLNTAHVFTGQPRTIRFNQFTSNAGNVIIAYSITPILDAKRRGGVASISTTVKGFVDVTVNQPGSFTITARQGGTNTFNSTTISRTLNCKLTQSIIPPTNLLNTYPCGVTTIPLGSATSGLPITAKVINGTGAATVSGNRLRLTRTGTFQLQFNQSGDYRYYPATFTRAGVTTVGATSSNLNGPAPVTRVFNMQYQTEGTTPFKEFNIIQQIRSQYPALANQNLTNFRPWAIDLPVVNSFGLAETWTVGYVTDTCQTSGGRPTDNCTSSVSKTGKVGTVKLRTASFGAEREPLSNTKPIFGSVTWDNAYKVNLLLRESNANTVENRTFALFRPNGDFTSYRVGKSTLNRNSFPSIGVTITMPTPVLTSSGTVAANTAINNIVWGFECDNASNCNQTLRFLVSINYV
jgi:hypothetical protein